MFQRRIFLAIEKAFHLLILNFKRYLVYCIGLYCCILWIVVNEREIMLFALIGKHYYLNLQYQSGKRKVLNFSIYTLEFSKGRVFNISLFNISRVCKFLYV